jgi:hypothetical protein
MLLALACDARYGGAHLPRCLASDVNACMVVVGLFGHLVRRQSTSLASAWRRLESADAAWHHWRDR